MKNLTAIITDGMHNTDEVKVKSISVWINRNVNHTVNDESINELIKKGNESGQMHIYQYCIAESLEGRINATEGTALYTNGQKTVDKLLLNGIEIWNRRKIKN